MVENRLVGMKSRGVYETPAGTILYAAHNNLEEITLDRATMHYKETVAIRFAELVYDGCWIYSPARSSQRICRQHPANRYRTVRLKLYKGNCVPARREISLFAVQRGNRNFRS